MRFFTDQYFSDAQKTKLLENSHLVEHLSVRLEEQEIPASNTGHMFCTEWQQEHRAPVLQTDDGPGELPPVTDLSSVMLMMLVGCFGFMFVFDVLL
jgi:hypothetical protein